MGERNGPLPRIEMHPLNKFTKKSAGGWYIYIIKPNFPKTGETLFVISCKTFCRELWGWGCFQWAQARRPRFYNHYYHFTIQQKKFDNLNKITFKKLNLKTFHPPLMTTLQLSTTCNDNLIKIIILLFFLLYEVNLKWHI